MSLCDILLRYAVPIAITLGAWLAWEIWSYLSHPLYRFPGPWLASWSNVPYSFWLLRGRQPFVMYRLHQQYGSVVRIAPNELSFSTVTSWDDIYGVRPGHQPFRKGDFYGGGSFHEEATSIVTERDPEVHRMMRKQLLQAFSERAIHSQEGLVLEVVDDLFEQISLNAKSGPVDMTRWLDMALFDLTGSLAFGQSFNALKDGGKHPSVAFILKALRQLSVVDTLRRMPTLAVIAKLLFRRTVQELTEGNKRHEQNCMELIVSRQKRPTDRPDFLTHITKDNKGVEIRDVQLAAHAADLLQAGAHSVNTTLCTAIYFLLRNPDCMAKLQSEVWGKFQSYDQINARSVQHLQYTRAVCQEAMRLYPPVPLGLPRVVPECGDTVDGEFLPGGTVVCTSPMAASLSPAYFTEPLEFRPERWLQEHTKDHLRASQPFILGMRGCMGQNLAWVELLCILSKLVLLYEMKLHDQQLDWVRDSSMSILWEKPALLVDLAERPDTVS